MYYYVEQLYTSTHAQQPLYTNDIWGSNLVEQMF